MIDKFQRDIGVKSRHTVPPAPLENQLLRMKLANDTNGHHLLTS